VNYSLERLLSRTPLYDLLTDRRLDRELYKWLENGRPCPPPHLVKQSVVKEYARQYRLGTLVETGTYLGFMIRATLRVFQRVYSVELDEVLHRRAARKFSRYKHITVLQGDSSTVLAKLLPSLHEPCLFWLDAHHSSGATFKTGKGNLLTPIVAELEQILAHSHAQQHVILIDDAREFTGENDYPTLSALRELVLHLHPTFTMEVADDIIRIHRKQALPQQQ
jgi:hypothetical protein